MSETTPQVPVSSLPPPDHWRPVQVPPARPKRSPLLIAGAVVGALALLGIGIGIGASSKSTPAAIVRTHIVIRTQTVKVPGPTVTKIVKVKVPGPTVTKTAGPPPPSATMPGDGTFVVGTVPGQWAPGTWQTSGAVGGSSGDCYWATLNDLTGGLNSIAANDNITGPTVITVSPGLAGVQVSGCNTWNKIG